MLCTIYNQRWVFHKGGVAAAMTWHWGVTVWSSHWTL